MLGLLGVVPGAAPFTQPSLEPPFTQLHRSVAGTLLDAAGDEAAMKRPACIAPDAHIAFIAIENKSSTSMRGWMTTSVLKRAYGQDSSVVLLDRAHGSVERMKTIKDHFAVSGRPTVCVILKWPTLEAISACRHQGALVFLDCIDNPECANRDYLAREEFRRVDALLVQTQAHKKALEGLPKALPGGLRKAIEKVIRERGRAPGSGTAKRGTPKNLWSKEMPGFDLGEPELPDASRELKKLKKLKKRREVIIVPGRRVVPSQKLDEVLEELRRRVRSLQREIEELERSLVKPRGSLWF